MAEKSKQKIVPIPDDKEYAPDIHNEFPDEYYVGPFPPEQSEENQLLPGTSLWYDTARDVVKRWDGSSWNVDPTADKWVLNQLTSEPLGRVVGDKESKNRMPKQNMSLDEMLDADL